jgi:leader peptidase (prepilin peptidase)/N-methyltransferase
MRDNIPIISFLLLRGRCRDCGEPISWRYPAVELITGLLFALVYFRQGVQLGTGPGVLIVMMLVTALLIVASGIDIDWLIIPDEISLGGILGGLLAGLLLPQLHVGPAPYHTFSGPTAHPHLVGLAGSGIGALVGGGTVLGCALIGFIIFRREAMGIGDAKLMAMFGAFFGWKAAVISFFIAPFVGLLYGIPLLLMDDEHVMPYGPFLSIAGLLTIIFRTSLTHRLEPLGAFWEILVG